MSGRRRPLHPGTESERAYLISRWCRKQGRHPVGRGNRQRRLTIGENGAVARSATEANFLRQIVGGVLNTVALMASEVTKADSSV
jgi:hypothetical protein